MTLNGVAEFAYLLGNYGYNSPISSSDVQNFPVCDSDGNGYYLAVGCSSSGGFTIDRFTDQYCTEYYDTYETLSNFNSAMNKMKCYNCYNSNQGSDVSYSVASYLLSESSSCSEAESSLCTTTSFVSSSGGFQRVRSYGSGSAASFSNKVKYTLGSAMLLGSVFMFIGILFTNRRKRHAMMNRKFRSSSDKKKKKKRSSSSSKKSKSKRASGGIFA